MKRSQRARRISAREQSRRRRQRLAAQRAEQERAQLRTITEQDIAASASGIHRMPTGLLTGGAQTTMTRTQARGR